MYRRILILTVASLAMTACMPGVRPTPAPLLPDLIIPPAQMVACPAQLPDPASGKRSDLLANHVEAARIYHACRIGHDALVCTVTGLQGVTINGARPQQSEACQGVPARVR